MDNKDQTYNIVEAIKAQKQYCQDKQAPHFALNNGICWSCSKNIYAPIEHEGKSWNGEEVQKWTTGISVGKAEKELVTGCPHCNRSYCD